MTSARRPRVAAKLLFFGLLAIILNGCGRALDAEFVQKFEQAQNEFDAAKQPADYLRVAGIYGEIRRGGVVNGAVLFNQGNAYMRAGQRGRAIACYREATRYRPRDPYLRENLRFALGGISARPTGRSVIDYVVFWKDWLSYPEKFQTTLVIGVIAFLLGLASLRFRSKRMFRRMAWTSLVIAIVFAGSAAFDWFRFDATEYGVVIEEQTTVRKGNAESYQPAFTAPLDEGAECIVLERRDDWIRIQILAGEGWVKSDAVDVY